METLMRPLPRRSSPFRAMLAVALTAGVLATSPTAPAAAENRVTPGNFTGYGFDQCVAPESWKMDRWMAQSPFSAVGIYISGASRGCRTQPNLTPSWISHQLENGWRLLPITLGPQAACHPSFPRYGNDPTISTDRTRNYRKARVQARDEADTAVAAATKLGISKGSTLWYDLEGTDGLLNNTACRESALQFLHKWTKQIHRRGYVSGVYSSAGSGMRILDDARVNRPNAFTMPDAIWIARWDGRANLDACRDQPVCYVRTDGWQPHKRIKQYRGGHQETWGGVTINIDSNYMSLGSGSLRLRGRGLRCGDVPVDRRKYPTLNADYAPAKGVAAAKCLLTKKGLYDGPLDGSFSQEFLAAANAWQRRVGDPVQPRWTKRNWTQALARGREGVVKVGTSKARVKRVQRALMAATNERLAIDGVFLGSSERVMKIWQRRVGLPQTGVVNDRAWELLKAGRRS
ncbi:glycoside hydrolase domain-containing protein [Nocardioides donggukensis]|uniref:DUF1906 domain-containing protein n=1 Tax=Nocardioides donggukensis TaxID=2774019 RepID=A0A927K1F1_9ACTN|nr:glycoside hydrolase domain-containing protein [Nocardioides donggukensis]MBD8868269.1 DUF1906 domain-containing protein [Nocardioides donggukensis]